MAGVLRLQGNAGTVNVQAEEAVHMHAEVVAVLFPYLADEQMDTVHIMV